MGLQTIAYSAATLLMFVSSVQAEGVSIAFKNASKFEIHGLFLSTTKDKEWGPEQLGEKTVIATGGSFTLTHIEPGKYDMKLVDEDGDECVIGGIKMAADKEVEITDKDLLECQAATEEAGEGEE